MGQTEAAWHLDKKVPISIIVMIFMQFAGFVWWGAKFDSRVAAVEQSDGAQSIRLQSVEGSVQTMQVGAATLTAQLAALKEALDEVRTSQHETNDLLRQLTAREPKP